MRRYSVLFVCLGNICRSPMAEAVLRSMIRERGLDPYVHVDSAGTGDWHIGKPPHEGTRRLLDKHRIPYEGMTARRLADDDGETFDLIVAMDRSNEADIRERLGAPRAEVIRFLSLLPHRGMEDVPDPYYTGNFDEVYELVKEGCQRLTDKIADRVNVRRSDRPSAFTPLPLLRRVTQEELTSRLEAVKTLSDDGNELYRIVKDTACGDHYLHYAVRHVNLAGGAAEEQYHHLLPLSYDDVIALAMGEDEFAFPVHWRHAYLRNGPEGAFVWYDPDGAPDDAAAYEQAAEQIKAKLLDFRRKGGTPEELEKLLAEMDELLPPGGRPQA